MTIRTIASAVDIGVGVVIVTVEQGEYSLRERSGARSRSSAAMREGALPGMS